MIANFIRGITLLVLLSQDGLLTYYFAAYNGISWLGWIALDFIVAVGFVVSFVFADRYFKRVEKANPDLRFGKPKKQIVKSAQLISDTDIAPDFRTDPQPESQGELWDKSHTGALPTAYIIWLVYAATHIAKVVCIFETFGPTLSEKDVFGTTMLDVALTLTAVLFAFLVTTTHHKIPASSEQKSVIRWMQNHAILDLLDSVEILGYLFENEQQLAIDRGSRIAILTFVSVNLFLPACGLYQLSAGNHAKRKPREDYATIQQLLSSLLGNLPFLVIRIYLWHSRSHSEGSFIFVLKNIFGIVNNTYDFYKLVENKLRPPEEQEDEHKNPAVTCDKC